MIWNKWNWRKGKLGPESRFGMVRASRVWNIDDHVIMLLSQQVYLAYHHQSRLLLRLRQLGDSLNLLLALNRLHLQSIRIIPFRSKVEDFKLGCESVSSFPLKLSGTKIYYKLGCVVRMVVDSILPHAKSGPNDNRKGAPPFIISGRNFSCFSGYSVVWMAIRGQAEVKD